VLLNYRWWRAVPESSVLRGIELFLACFMAGWRNGKTENLGLLDVSA